MRDAWLITERWGRQRKSIRFESGFASMKRFAVSDGCRGASPPSFTRNKQPVAI